ncbi:MAG: response regulator transcription factor [Oscillochloris sp.]|nr:response regulator transcription factor [Oscillochloris sp.]
MASAYTILLAGLGSRIDDFLVPVLTGQGHIVHTAVGPSAIFAALDVTFDLALVDLPTEKELVYLRELRDRCVCAVVVIGPSRNDRLLVASLEHGADDYVQRPFRTDELMARIRAQLRRVQRNRLAGENW